MKAWPLLTPAVTWLVLWFAGPLVLVVAASLASRGEPMAWVFSTAAWRGVADPAVLRVLGRTLTMALLTALGTLAAGVPMAWLIVRSRPRVGRLLLGLVLLPLAANSLVLVYAWMSLLARDGLLGSVLAWAGLVPEGGQWLYTPGASLLGMIYYYLPFMVYPVVAALGRMDWRLVEAAADLGASGVQTLRHVVLPLAWPGVAAGAVLVFVQAVGTFVIPDLLGGSKAMLAGTLISQRFVGQSHDWPAGAALSVVVTLIMLTGLAVSMRLQRRMGA